MSIEVLTRTILEKMDGIGKWQRDFFINLILLWLEVRGRYNFENLSRQGLLSAVSYCNWFSQAFVFAAFNHLLIEHYTGKERIIAFDPSFIAKSGKHTHGLSYLRIRCRHRRRSGSSCAQSMKKGLEIAGLASSLTFC